MDEESSLDEGSFLDEESRLPDEESRLADAGFLPFLYGPDLCNVLILNYC